MRLDAKIYLFPTFVAASLLGVMSFGCQNGSDTGATDAIALNISAEEVFNNLLKMPASARSEFYGAAAASPASAWSQTLLTSIGSRSVYINGVPVDTQKSLSIYRGIEVPMGTLWRAVGFDPATLTYDAVLDALAKSKEAEDGLSLDDGSTDLPGNIKAEIDTWLEAGSPDPFGYQLCKVNNPTPILPYHKTESDGTSYVYDTAQYQIQLERTWIGVDCVMTGTMRAPEGSFAHSLLKGYGPHSVETGGGFAGDRATDLRTRAAIKAYTASKIKEIRARSVINLIVKRSTSGTKQQDPTSD